MSEKRTREILESLGPIEALRPVESIPLEEAEYCVSCGTVTRSVDSAKACVVCGAKTLLNLARALYRDGMAVA